MVSHNESEGIEPRNMTKSHWAKGFSIWKPVALHAMKGECVSDVPGSEALAGHSMIHIGLDQKAAFYPVFRTVRGVWPDTVPPKRALPIAASAAWGAARCT